MSAKLGVSTIRTTLALLRVTAGVAAYTFVTSCENLIDADDTLCQALAAAKNGEVDWPEDRHWYPTGEKGRAFDHIMASPWRLDFEAQRHIEGFGIAQGHNWGHLGRQDLMTYDVKSLEVNTPLARTYNGYANIVYANLEGVHLDRARPLHDFEYYDTFLKWSSAFVSQKTYRVDGNCRRDCEFVGSNRCTIARTVNGRIRKRHYIELYQTFFYEIDSVWRAATIIHEVRHARDRILHDGGANCPAQTACDRSWSSAGSNTYETLWSLDQLRSINEIPEFYLSQAACSDDPQEPHHCIGLR